MEKRVYQKKLRASVRYWEGRLMENLRNGKFEDAKDIRRNLRLLREAEKEQ